MKPFDLEAAKRGEPFGYLMSNGAVEQRRFIGVTQGGLIVYQNLACHHHADSHVQVAHPNFLRMMPKQMSCAVNIFRNPKTGSLFVGDEQFGLYHSAKWSAEKYVQAYPDHQYVGTTYVRWEE